MKTYRIEFEETETGFSAYVPELPGCVAAAQTFDDTKSLIVDAIELHLDAAASSSYFVVRSTPIQIYVRRDTSDVAHFSFNVPDLSAPSQLSATVSTRI